MTKAKTHFVCQACGYQAPKWLGRCPGCQEWNTFAEERLIEEKVPGRDLLGFESEAVQHLSLKLSMWREEDFRSSRRIWSSSGRRIVFGSVILVGGDPGIGKSTLLLQVMNRLASKGRKSFNFWRGVSPADQNEGRSVRRFLRTLFVVSETSLEKNSPGHPNAQTFDRRGWFHSNHLFLWPPFHTRIDQPGEGGVESVALSGKTSLHSHLSHRSCDERGVYRGPKVLEHMSIPFFTLRGRPRTPSASWGQLRIVLVPPMRLVFLRWRIPDW